MHRNVYSYSKIATYERCPLSFQYRYIDKIKVPYDTIELFLGNTVHTILESLYNNLDILPGNLISVEGLQNDFQKIWKENYNDSVKLREGQTEEEYFEKGMEMIALYHKNNYPFDQEICMGAEMELKWHIGDFKFWGYIDRVSLNLKENKITIHDYKTSSKLPEKEKILNKQQLVLYKIALEEQYPEMEIEMVYHYLQFGEEIRFTKTDEEQEKIKKEVIKTIRRIEIDYWENNFKARVDNKCKWCDYSTICYAYNKENGNKVTVQTKLF